MAIQLSVAARNDRLDSFETTVGADPILEIRTGVPPANCGAADAGTLLASLVLPSDWMDAASGGSKSKSGTWEDLDADASGTAGHFRVKNAAGTVCHMQGTVSEESGGGDMELSQVTADVVEGQTVKVSSFTLTDGNA